MTRYLSLLLFLTFTYSWTLPAQVLRPEEPVRFLALGDSYTYGQSVSRQQTWPAQFHDSLVAYGYDVELMDIIAVTGWRTDQLMNGINQAEPLGRYNLVSLLIGVNNQFQGMSVPDYEPEFRGLLERAIDIAASKDNVFVLSIPDYAYTPFGQQGDPGSISDGIDTFNRINRIIAEEAGVRYYNITDISRQGLSDTGLVAADGLHPSAGQYTLWVERILQDVERKSQVTTSLTLSDGSSSKEVLRVFPNPAEEKITLEIPGEGYLNAWVEIMTISGITVMAFEIPRGKRTEILTKNLAAGSYIIRARTSTGSYSTVLIKK